MSNNPDYIGRFQILATLGIGGMGVVYSAKDPDIGRKVAIKVLHATGDETALERFKNEARTIGEISHPNIVILLEYGIDNNKPYLVMEYLGGDALNQWIKKVHTLRENKSVMLDLCNAIQYAHSKDILHRDLKPGNIQVLSSGQAKLLDFGIATSQVSGLSQSPNSGLTATGFFIGTPKYLAPEILNDTTHTKTSDCYSLGLLAYTMLSGINPFASNSFEATMTKILTKTPRSLHEINQKIPIELSDTIDKYLVKDPSQRPHTPELLKLALESMIKPKELDAKIITSSLDSNPSVQDPTVIVGKQKKGYKKTFAIMALVPVLGLAGFMGYKYLNMPSEINQQITNKPIVITKIDKPKTGSSTDDEKINPSELVNQDDKPNENNDNFDPNPKDEEVANNDSTKPNQAEPIKQNVEKPPVKVAVTKPKDKPKDKPKQKPKPVVVVPKETVTYKPPVVVYQKPKPKKNNRPIFKLPDFNQSNKRVALTTLSDTQVPRGRTKTINIKIPNGIDIEKFKIMRGLSEFDQVEIRNVKKWENNRIDVTLYAQSNATMGDFAIVGFYQNKKTKPLILEVAL